MFTVGRLWSVTYSVEPSVFTFACAVKEKKRLVCKHFEVVTGAMRDLETAASRRAGPPRKGQVEGRPARLEAGLEVLEARRV